MINYKGKGFCSHIVQSDGAVLPWPSLAEICFKLESAHDSACVQVLDGIEVYLGQVYRSVLL